MKDSIKTGISFGVTSGTITTLGLMVGLSAGTHSKAAVVGGILTIAIADSFSDALGIHISQEAQDNHTGKGVWESTVATYITKLLYALTFVVPVILFDLSLAVWVSVVWGIGILAMFSYVIAKNQKEGPIRAMLEHVSIGVIVILITHYLGLLISRIFN